MDGGFALPILQFQTNLHNADQKSDAVRNDDGRRTKQ
jgi:hypothetical protein